MSSSFSECKAKKGRRQRNTATSGKHFNPAAWLQFNTEVKFNAATLWKLFWKKGAAETFLSALAFGFISHVIFNSIRNIMTFMLWGIEWAEEVETFFFCALHHHARLYLTICFSASTRAWKARAGRLVKSDRAPARMCVRILFSRHLRWRFFCEVSTQKCVMFWEFREIQCSSKVKSSPHPASEQPTFSLNSPSPTESCPSVVFR